MTEHWSDQATIAIKRMGPLCVGIDPFWETIPDCFKMHRGGARATLIRYGRSIIDSIIGHVGFIKPQIAFFEAFGTDGIGALEEIISHARDNGLLVILDAKRGDIGSTAKAYANAYLAPGSGSGLEVDCITINPFLGRDSLLPFIEACEEHKKGVFVLLRTSNEDWGWLQQGRANDGFANPELMGFIEERSKATVGDSGYGNVGAVVGATHPEFAKEFRKQMPTTIFLTPGLGAQGGSAEKISDFGDGEGLGFVAPVSRGIIKVDDTTISEGGYAEHVARSVGIFKENLS